MKRKLKRWLTKQLWRMEQSWTIHRIPKELALFIVWILGMGALIGIQLSWETGAFLFITGFLYLWISGYIGDKTGFWRESASRRMKMVSSEAYLHQVTLGGAINAKMIVKALEANPEKLKELENIIRNELDWFEQHAIE